MNGAIGAGKKKKKKEKKGKNIRCQTPAAIQTEIKYVCSFGLQPLIEI